MVATAVSIIIISSSIVYQKFNKCNIRRINYLLKGIKKIKIVTQFGKIENVNSTQDTQKCKQKFWLIGVQHAACV